MTKSAKSPIAAMHDAMAAKACACFDSWSRLDDSRRPPSGSIPQISRRLTQKMLDRPCNSCAILATFNSTRNKKEKKSC